MFIKLAGRLACHLRYFWLRKQLPGEPVTKAPRSDLLRVYLACSLFALVIANEGLAQTVDSNAPRPIAQAIELTTKPFMDGNVLDDPAWRGAEPITDFWQSQPN